MSFSGDWLGISSIFCRIWASRLCSSFRHQREHRTQLSSIIIRFNDTVDPMESLGRSLTFFFVRFDRTKARPPALSSKQIFLQSRSNVMKPGALTHQLGYLLGRSKSLEASVRFQGLSCVIFMVARKLAVEPRPRRER